MQIVCNKGVIRINRWNLAVLLLMIQRVILFSLFFKQLSLIDTDLLKKKKNNNFENKMELL